MSCLFICDSYHGIGARNARVHRFANMARPRASAYSALMRKLGGRESVSTGGNGGDANYVLRRINDEVWCVYSGSVRLVGLE